MKTKAAEFNYANLKMHYRLNLNPKLQLTENKIYNVISKQVLNGKGFPETKLTIKNC